jgi:hypothetical protein
MTGPPWLGRVKLTVPVHVRPPRLSESLARSDLGEHFVEDLPDLFDRPPDSFPGRLLGRKVPDEKEGSSHLVQVANALPAHPLVDMGEESLSGNGWAAATSARRFSHAP